MYCRHYGNKIYITHTHTHTYIYIYIIICLSLTHWGRVTHICVSNLTMIGSDNGLAPTRREVILWIRPLGTNFSEILIEFLTFWFKKMPFNLSSAKWRPFCLGLNVLNEWWYQFTSNETTTHGVLINSNEFKISGVIHFYCNNSLMKNNVCTQ